MVLLAWGLTARLVPRGGPLSFGGSCPLGLAVVVWPVGEDELLTGVPRSLGPPVGLSCLPCLDGFDRPSSWL